MKQMDMEALRELFEKLQSRKKRPTSPTVAPEMHFSELEKVRTYVRMYECVCCHLLRYIRYVRMYSGTSLLWTPLGQENVSSLERCPYSLFSEVDLYTS